MTENWILIIDPFQSILNTYRMVLERKKYLVDTSKDLDGAFHQFSMRQYSIIITEYLHPIEDLYHMIQWVKQNSPETCIIMVTSLILDEPIYEKLFDLGLDDFILKPYPPEKILVHIRKGLKQRELVLKKQELERQSLLDPIAQRIQQFIFNSTYFKKCLHQEIGRAKRHQHPLSLLLIQIPDGGAIGDRFKDFCIELVRVVRTSIREGDTFGRDNGSFGVILPETDHIGSQALVSRLSNLVQTHPIFQSDQDLKSIIKTLSFQSFTYPEKFIIPESLKDVLEEDSKKNLPQ
jgi:PleD family two-component response regulator